MKGYKITDDLHYLDKVQRYVSDKYGKQLWSGLVNGFCMAALTETWFSGAHNSDCVFNPKFKLTRNEDELQGRWLKLGRNISICPSSFVWHYRSVTRKPSGRERNAFRLKKGK